METITYLILPICSYFSPQTLAQQNLISSSFSGTNLGYVIGNQTVHPTIRDTQSRPDGDGRYCDGPISNFGLSCLQPPSRYGLLTGRYPGRSGFGWVLNPDSPRGHSSKGNLRWQEGLKGQGCYSHGMEKWQKKIFWGERQKPEFPNHFKMGFDDYVGLPYMQR